jgi:Fe-S cluster assembly protein SufD
MNAVTPDTSLHYLEQYTRGKKQLPGHSLPWLGAWREKAMRDFVAGGLPSLRDEDWKYTSLAAIERHRFALASGHAGGAIDEQTVVPMPIGRLAKAPDESPVATLAAALALPGTRRLVFVDGRHEAALSSRGELPEGVVVESMADMLEREPQAVEAALIDPAKGAVGRNGFAALNAACLSDGAYIQLADGAALAEPIHLLFIARTPELAIHTRNLIVAAHDSRAVIIEHHVALADPAGSGAPAYLTNVVTDLALGRGAHIEHYKVQDESTRAFHIAEVAAALARDAHFLSASFAFGGSIARADIRVALNGEGAECTLDGLYVGDGRQHVDHHTRIDHNRPRGTSRELYKGVLGGAARGVFNGKVFVHPGAQKSDAAQTNRNLLLSPLAEIDTKPQLEIWADDVKCNHGATVGQLDADQIFYLRARGIDEAAARAVLTHAFAAEMLDRVPLPALREYLDTLLRERLPIPKEARP